MSDNTLLADTSHWSGDIEFEMMYAAVYPQRLTGVRGIKMSNAFWANSERIHKMSNYTLLTDTSHWSGDIN